MIELFCVDCDATLGCVSESRPGRYRLRCEACKREKELQRGKDKAADDKRQRYAARHPNCARCGASMLFHDTATRMDMNKFCGACKRDDKRRRDTKYHRKLGMRPIAEIREANAQKQASRAAAKAEQRAERERALEDKRRKCPWLNPKLTDAQAYRLQYKLDSAFREREVARSVKRHKETPLLRIWENIIARCENPIVKGYHRYGGRGIKVLEPFRSSFQAFVDYMGPRPSPMHSVDRIDVDGHYAPGNVRWADPITQRHNISKLKTTPAMLAAAMRARMEKQRQRQDRRARADRELASVGLGQATFREH